MRSIYVQNLVSHEVNVTLQISDASSYAAVANWSGLVSPNETVVAITQSWASGLYLLHATSPTGSVENREFALGCHATSLSILVSSDGITYESSIVDYGAAGRTVAISETFPTHQEGS